MIVFILCTEAGQSPPMNVYRIKHVLFSHLYLFEFQLKKILDGEYSLCGAMDMYKPTRIGKRHLARNYAYVCISKFHFRFFFIFTLCRRGN